ncbi:hypothetical protein B0H16DRAFT_1478375 [Mycena metata]|uniref:Uncharacterized protein n=1 Tax=Mycena metata TaxID=1033252 RepID=A0AAD7H7B7_9AGAR|nr:hypothetical protein B0H16DRAFT_1478375 [Mycena metata]
MACNLSKQPDRFLRMFVETTAVMLTLKPFPGVIAHHTEIYEMFSGFCNKFRQFWAARPGAYPREVRDIITFTDDLRKMRARSSGTRDSTREAGLEKVRADKEAALAEAQARTQKVIRSVRLIRLYSRLTLLQAPRRKGPITPATIETDDEYEDGEFEQDSEMPDAIPDLEGDDEVEVVENSALHSAENSALHSALFGDKASFAPAASAVPPVKPIPTGPKAQTLPNFNKHKPGRPETVRIPYTRHRRIDKTSSAYAKAQTLLSKTDPLETIKVAAEPDAPSSRKRARRSSFYEFQEAQPPLQGSSAILKAAMTSKPSPPDSDGPRLVATATAIVNGEGCGIATSRALALQEFDTRSNISVTLHRLAYQLALHDALVQEHQRLLKEMKNRDLPVFKTDHAHEMPLPAPPSMVAPSRSLRWTSNPIRKYLIRKYQSVRIRKSSLYSDTPAM